MSFNKKKYIVTKKDEHGNFLGYEFRPSPLMQCVLYDCINPRNATLSIRQILKQRGVKFSTWQDWQKNFIDNVEHVDDATKERTVEARNWFIDWWEEELHRSRMNLQQMLAHVGVKKAMEGDHRFWKDMSRTLGVITQEPKEQGEKQIPIDLGKKDATIDEIRVAKFKLLQSLRGVGVGDGDKMARVLTDQREEPET